MKITIIGASAAGLACAKLLRDQGFDPVLLERARDVGDRWRHHYDRLHLHTEKRGSALPGLAFPSSTPRYASRDQLVAYLEDYARHFDLRPQFGVEVTRLLPADTGWQITSTQGTRHTDLVVVATGLNNIPNRVDKPGLENFPGRVLHSSDYRSGRDFVSQRVLVIGFGNSACEIAIDLHEQGAHPSQSVRGPVNVLPRDIFGVPITTIGRYAGRMPPEVSDRLFAPLLRLLLGDVRQLGLERPAYGPITQVRRHGQIPLMDIGTLRLMRQGKIGVFPDITGIDGSLICFADGRQAEFDAIVMATGYHHGIERLVDLSDARLQDMTCRIDLRQMEGQGGLYFCGGFVSPRGMLHEIGIEAKAIARMIADRAI